MPVQLLNLIMASDSVNLTEHIMMTNMPYRTHYDNHIGKHANDKYNGKRACKFCVS